MAEIIPGRPVESAPSCCNGGSGKQHASCDQSASNEIFHCIVFYVNNKGGVDDTGTTKFKMLRFF